jgi:CubicO group peptidase (beta-lactamase class C family)
VTVTSERIDSAVSALDGLVKGVMKSSGVPGVAVAVVRNDRVVYAKGFGVRQVGTSASVNADTVFMLASVSKSLASTEVARHTRDADAESPAAGVSSSVNDMAKWMRLQLAAGKFDGKQIVDGDALLATQTPQIVSKPPASPSSRPSFYGLGLNVGSDDSGRVRLSHSGAFNLGASTAFLLIPALNLGIIALCNGMPIGVPEAVANSFADLVEAGKVERDWLSFLYKAAFAPCMSTRASWPARRVPPVRPRPRLRARTSAATRTTCTARRTSSPPPVGWRSSSVPTRPLTHSNTGTATRSPTCRRGRTRSASPR